MRLGIRISVFGMLLITALVMFPALKGGFFFDDNPNIVENTAVHITQLSIDSLKQSLSGAKAGPLGRPVSVLSFALTHYFFGLNAVAFKTINLLIHLVNGLLVYWIIMLLFQNMKESTLPIPPPWMGLCVATLWLVHPINIMPVMLVVQRMTLLSGLFLLLAMGCHLTAVFMNTKNKFSCLWLVIGWLICWPLSVLSKESGILFPFYALVMMFFIRTTSQRSVNKYAWRVVMSVNIFLMLMVLWLLVFRWNWVEAGYAMRSFSLEERLMTQARVLWFYLKQIALPDYFAFGVYLDDIAISHHLLKPFTTLTSIMGWVVGIVISLKYWRRYPLPCFGLIWFLVGHLLESTFLSLEIAHEHRNYIPSMGVIAGLVWFGFKVIQKIKIGDKLNAIKVILAVAMILFLSLLTWLRANQLGDPFLSPQLEAQRHPQSASANYEAAVALFKAGRGHATEDPALGQMIKAYFEQANAVDPTFRLGYIGLIVWACASNIPVETRWIDEFSQRLKNAPIGPADITLPKKVGQPILSMPTCLTRQQAEQLFKAGADNLTATWMTKSQFMEWLGDYELVVIKDIKMAKIYLTEALRFSPTNAELRNKLESLNKIPD